MERKKKKHKYWLLFATYLQLSGDVFTPFENWRNADINTRVLDACGRRISDV
jgi:hypothetical protein